MELLQLRYFQAVARREHVSQAAQELHVTQPSLSRTVARLETELGVPLFDRQGRRLALNRFGAAFLRRVDRALDELDNAQTELNDAAGLEHGSVAVAAETLLTLTPLLADFLAQHPGVSFKLYQSSAETMANQLHTGQVDLGIASQPLRDPSLTTLELSREEVLLAVPPKHPLAQRQQINLNALAEEPFITTRPGHWLRTLADHLFTTAGAKPTIACEGDEPTAIRPLISAGLGIGLLPQSSRPITHPQVAWLQLKTQGARRTLTLAWRTDSYLSTAAQHFRDLATQHFRQTPPPSTARTPPG